MHKGRLEAFSDGVLAIIITIMVLEIKVPHGQDFVVLRPLLPVIVSYVLSFIYLAIYWNNHHHMLYTVKFVTGDILWANLHLLFWLSLIPFVTGWIGENAFAPLPMALYGVVLLFCAVAYFILQSRIIKSHGPDSILAKAIGKDMKGKMSPILYFVAICASYFSSWVAGGIYVFVAFMWLVPDKRIEVILQHKEEQEKEKQV
ncbi:TMEM175 family protein [Pontibacter chitinilyticus]|uniref:TMEM175 family protein n=1 Tax=Pontibacter chitinilyticus TaxID=2674989 RepID=UPI00321B0BCA